MRAQGAGREICQKCAVTNPVGGLRERFAVVLVDTSVWIEFFRKPSRFRLESVGELKVLVTCLPVIQEVLQGFRDEQDFRLAREAMHSLLIVESPLRSEVFDEAVQLYRQARRAGYTLRSGVDCLIAACALRHNLTVLHNNRDFDVLSRVSALQAREIFL